MRRRRVIAATAALLAAVATPVLAAPAQAAGGCRSYSVSGGTYTVNTLRNTCTNLAGAYRITTYNVRGEVYSRATVQLGPQQTYSYYRPWWSEIERLG